jgi:DNA oxidative demethylase
MTTLFEQNQQFAEGAFLLPGFALPCAATFLAEINTITLQAPLRHMMTPMGFNMSAAMSNCGDLGWVTDRKGYRYTALDPVSQQPWPNMPASFLQLASAAAAECGFTHFVPDACLINQYHIGASMGLHQDKDERDFSQPIVSVSLGITATFLFGSLKRTDKPAKIQLNHGDMLVWGGATRLNFHGIAPLKKANHALFGNTRVNLTFRKAG